MGFPGEPTNDAYCEQQTYRKRNSRPTCTSAKVSCPKSKAANGLGIIGVLILLSHRSQKHRLDLVRRSELDLAMDVTQTARPRLASSQDLAART
jgi:hypothetical protein